MSYRKAKTLVDALGTLADVQADRLSDILADVKNEALVDAQANTLAEKMAETQDEPLGAMEAETLVEALADTIKKDQIRNTVEKHRAILRRTYCSTRLEGDGGKTKGEKLSRRT